MIDFSFPGGVRSSKSSRALKAHPGLAENPAAASNPKPVFLTKLYSQREALERGCCTVRHSERKKLSEAERLRETLQKTTLYNLQDFTRDNAFCFPSRNSEVQDLPAHRAIKISRDAHRAGKRKEKGDRRCWGPGLLPSSV